MSLQQIRRTCACSKQPATGYRPAGLRPRSARRLSRAIKAQADDEARSQGESIESLFLKELQKRGISSEDAAGGKEVVEAPVRRAKDPFTTTSTQLPPSIAPPTTSSSRAWADDGQLDDQLSRSRQLNSEGLEGLVPRATRLVQLGGSLFLAFLPFMAAISLLFGGIYWVFGERFVHSAPKSAGLPAYIDPDLLLNSPTVDPYVTFDSP